MEWNVTDVLTGLYLLMGGVALVGFLPQVIAFYRNPRLCDETPLTSWVLWSVQTFVFHLYAILVNGDTMFIINTGAFMWATFACLAMQVYGRHRAKMLGVKGRREALVLAPPQPETTVK
jgi:uncharacterized protein with PQ loop repeat